MNETEPTVIVLEHLAATIRHAMKHLDDPAEVLEVLAGIVRGADRAQFTEVHRMLDRGATWADVGQRLGVSRQAAAQRFGGPSWS